VSEPVDQWLERLVPRTPTDPDWGNVLHRARSSRRRFVGTVAAGGVLTLASASVALGFAIHTWFAGTPAPPPVAQQIEQQNQLPTNGPYVRPKIDSSLARGVAQVDTPDGTVHLWVAPTVNAGGLVCWFVDFSKDESPAAGRAAGGGGTCEQRPAPTTGFQWSYGWSEGHPAVNVLVGRVYVPATNVVVKLSSGQQMTLPVTEHLFLGTFSRSDSLAGLTAVAQDGSVVKTDDVHLKTG
jgi:hypothetical protein